MRDDYQFTKSVVLTLLNDFYESQTGERAEMCAASNFLYERKKKEHKDKDYEVLEWFEPNDDKIEAWDTVCKIKKIKRLSDGECFSVGNTINGTQEIVGINKHGYELGIITKDTTISNFNLSAYRLHLIKHNQS